MQSQDLKTVMLRFTSSPKIGASFVDYLLTINENGKNHLGFGGEGIEVFLYILEGQCKSMER